MAARFTIVGLGEALYDILPTATILGGAPLNLAVHAHQLAAAVGGGAAAGRGVAVSRVGQDDLGNRLIAELRQRGMAAEYVQTDPDKPTGQVYVSFDDQGRPSYEIVRDVAWDWLQFDFDLEDLARRCEAICFGSLAQREGQTRNTIYRALTVATRAVRLFDVNLRQNYYDRAILHRSCEMSTAMKLNLDELPIVQRTLGLGSANTSTETGVDQAAGALLKQYKLKMVVVTRGERGTAIYTPTGRFASATSVSYPAAADADSVGAGDACAAGILVGSVLRWPMERVVALADHMGAFVASQPGATPALPPSILTMVK